VTRVVLVLVLIGLTASTSAADPATADAAAIEADALAKAGKFVPAAAKFREAWQADKLRPELFCNIGISYYKAKDLVRAHLLLGQCLEQAALDPKFVEAVRRVLVSVEAVLGAGGHAPVRIIVEPQATTVAVVELAPDVAFVGSRVIWLAFGAYHLTAHAEGYTDATEAISLASTASRTVSVTLHKPVNLTGAVVEPPSPPPAVPGGAPPRPSVVPAYLATGGAVLALGVASYAFVAGHARAELAATALDPQVLADDRQAVSRWNTTLVIAGSVAVASAAAGGYLWYRVLHREPAIEVHAGPGSAGVSFSGRF
jgi:hypothetical protein